MSQPTTTLHNTFVLERSYAHLPPKVFAAFADPAKKRRWFAEGAQHTVEEFTMDFRPDGRETARYRFGSNTPFPGVELASDGWFLEIAENRRIVSAAAMSIGGRRMSAALVTIELRETAAGTDVILTHQAAFFEGSDGPQLREGGWRQLLAQLDLFLAAGE